MDIKKSSFTSMKDTQTSEMYGHANTSLKIFHTKELKPKCVCIHMRMYRQNTHIHTDIYCTHRSCAEKTLASQVHRM